MSLSENSSHLPSKRNPILRPCDLELEREEEILGVTHYAILFLSFLREFITYISYFLVPQTKDYSITVQPRFHFSEPNLTGNLSTLNQKDKTKEEILSLFPSES